MIGVGLVTPEAEPAVHADHEGTPDGEAQGGDIRGEAARSVGAEDGDARGAPCEGASYADAVHTAALPAAPALAAAVQQECLWRELIVELGGRHSGLIRLLPPLTITDEQAEAVLDRQTGALDATIRATGTRPRELPPSLTPFAPPPHSSLSRSPRRSPETTGDASLALGVAGNASLVLGTADDVSRSPEISGDASRTVRPHHHRTTEGGRRRAQDVNVVTPAPHPPCRTPQGEPPCLPSRSPCPAP